MFLNRLVRMTDAPQVQFLLPLKDMKGIFSLTLSGWDHCASLMTTKSIGVFNDGDHITSRLWGDP